MKFFKQAQLIYLFLFAVILHTQNIVQLSCEK